MLSIKDVKIDVASLGEKKLLTAVTPVYEYGKDGKRTDTISGYRYEIVLPEVRFEKLGVKIAGAKLVDEPTGCVEVEFENLEIMAYEMQGRVQLSAKATGIYLI